MLVTIQKIITEICVFMMMCMGTVMGMNNVDTQAKYTKNIDAVKDYENTVETAVPQTDIYSIIKNHFEAPLENGKTQKKAIVIGYDGCRADALSLMYNEDSSAILRNSENGTLCLSYCGGVNYPEFNKQATSTAPGWCSMLTGQWADVTGINANSVKKSNEHLTLLTSLVQDGVIDKSAFYVSWDGHFVDGNSTYILEKQYIKDNKLDVTFIDADDDDGTYENVVNDINNSECSDFVFSIFEYCDHSGHSSGFNLNSKKYVQAFYDAEQAANGIIDAIQAREAYESEDWLIIITSDHGGYNIWHGAMSIQERMTFISSNKPLGYNF